MQKMKHKVCIFNFNAALISHLCALWCCFTMKTFPHMHTCIILQSANPQAPPALSLRVSLVGITWSPNEKPNQASTKLSASFVCRQNSAVEIPPFVLG